MHRLFSIRSRKILALAITHTEGNYYDREEIKRMIPAERGMFDRVAAGLLECQDILLHNAKLTLVPAPTAAHAVIEAADDDGEAPEEESLLAAERPVSLSSDSSAAPTLTPPYMLVRVLEGMDTFMGVDGRIYTLAKGDVATLPERNASVLSGPESRHCNYTSVR